MSERARIENTWTDDRVATAIGIVSASHITHHTS